MSALLFAFVGAFLASLGARDQRLVARLAGRLGASRPLLVVALISAAASAAIAAWFGNVIGRDMSEDAASMFVAFALIFGAIELALPVRARLPEEPTRSLGALAIVLFARQITDAARFLIVAVAIASAAPLTAGIGGALGGGAAVGLGWAAGDALDRGQFPLKTLRRLVALLFLACGLYAALSARGIIG